MFRLVYKILPAFVFQVETDTGISMAIGNIVVIDREASEGVIAHELIHVKQNYRTLFTAIILYKLSQRYRLMYEVEAFKKQIEVDQLSDLHIMNIAEVLAEDYKIKYVSVADIYATLKG